MADWAQPVLTSLYTDVLNILKARDVDAGAMFPNEPGFTSAPDTSIHFSRANNSFYEKLAGTWTIKPIGLAGGGTGGSSAADARTNLGLGSMATQNANNVAITGGTISGISTFDVSGNFTVGGSVTAAYYVGNGGGLTNLNAATLTGILPGATFPDPIPARNGGLLYNLYAANLVNTAGVAPSAALGAGPASSATFLRGDGQWTVPPSAGGLPAGAVILFTTPCPPGFTHVAGWNGYYVRMGGSHVAGGANTHQHGPGSYSMPAHAHTSGTLATPSHNHGGGTGNVSVTISISGNTGYDGAHQHGYGGSISGTTGNDKAGSMNCDAGGSGVMSRSSHQHDFGANYSGDTDPVGTHRHTFSGSGSGTGTGTISNQSAMSINGSTGNAPAAAISGVSDIQNNMPLYIDFYACMKD